MSASKGHRFDGQKWYQKQIHERTIKALEQREEEFLALRAKDTDAALLVFIRERAGELGHSPQKEEVIGSSLMCDRFGSWEEALAACGLPAPRDIRTLKHTELYREESERQRKLYGEEKTARQEQKRKEAAAARAAQAEKKKKKKKKKIPTADRKQQ